MSIKEIEEFAKELMRERNWNEKLAYALAPVLYDQGIKSVEDFARVKQRS